MDWVSFNYQTFPILSFPHLKNPLVTSSVKEYHMTLTDWEVYHTDRMKRKFLFRSLRLESRKDAWNTRSIHFHFIRIVLPGKDRRRETMSLTFSVFTWFGLRRNKRKYPHKHCYTFWFRTLKVLYPSVCLDIIRSQQPDTLYFVLCTQFKIYYLFRFETRLSFLQTQPYFSFFGLQEVTPILN